MKCKKCGFENNNKAKFCTKCGSSLVYENPQFHSKEPNKSNIVIMGLIAIIVILVVAVGFFAFNISDSSVVSDDAQESNVQEIVQDNNEVDSDTQSVSSSKVVKSKSWKSIGKYSGSGSGSETIEVPEGKIKIKLSAYPIKNYASNYLYVTGSNGKSAGVDWGSKSAVETRSDSITYTSSSMETFTIDYYETVSWEVEFFRYE